MTRLLLVNPNTSMSTTDAMCRVAAAHAGDGVAIAGLTARRGAPLITDERALIEAAGALIELAGEIEATASDGVIVSAFGDPALHELRSTLSCPVTGIAEAAMAAAAEAGRRFAIVTTTPGLADAVARKARAYGHAAAFRGVYLTQGDVRQVMGDPARLVAALAEACTRAISAGAEAIVVGGGPLAEAALALQGRFNLPIIQPVPEAVRLAVLRATKAEPTPGATRH